MKKILLALSLFVNGFIFAQDLEISGGYVVNSFYDLEKETPHYNSRYQPGNGSVIKVSFENFKIVDSIVPVRLEINFTNYNSHAIIMNSSLGGGSSQHIDINKSVLGLCLYPLIFRIKDVVRIEIGCEMDILISDKSKGNFYSWSMTNTITTGRITDFDNKSKTFGLICQFGYEIRLKNNWYIFPRYHFYAGVDKEFMDTRSYRQQAEIGLIMRFD
jgi:hypothetical protein